MDNKLELMLKEYKNTILKLRNVYFKLEQKLKKEQGFSQEDSETFLENLFKEIISYANINNNNSNANNSKQQSNQEQDQESNNTITNNNKTDTTNNDTNRNNLPSYFQHFQ